MSNDQHRLLDHRMTNEPDVSNRNFVFEMRRSIEKKTDKSKVIFLPTTKAKIRRE